jgi:Holliday junction resolvasome RuvABC DNA-binding subunit
MSQEQKNTRTPITDKDIHIVYLENRITEKDIIIDEYKQKFSNFLRAKQKDNSLILSLKKEIKNFEEKLVSTENEKNKLINNKNEQIAKLEKKIIGLNEKIVEIKKSIILSTENANRNGRPPLSDEVIKRIEALLAEGYTQRQVAKIVGVSNGAVAKYDKRKEKEDQEW